MSLDHRIYFLGIIAVDLANPNGDPLNNNRPRQLYDGRGEISDVCIKRKIRNRLQDMGYNIFVQLEERVTDGFSSLAKRGKSIFTAEIKKDWDKYKGKACEMWMDVRAFGQIFAFPGENVSEAVRGPVTVSSACSLEPIDIYTNWHTKSASMYEPTQKQSDIMGCTHRIDHGAYVFQGGISPQLASLTGFSAEDAEAVKDAILTMFCNDESSARPVGSMELHRLYWWEHNCPSGQYSPRKVFDTINLSPCDTWPYYTVEHTPLPGLSPTIYVEGMKE